MDSEPLDSLEFAKNCLRSVRVGMRAHNVIVGRVDNALALAGVLKAAHRVLHVREIGLDGDVMYVGVKISLKRPLCMIWQVFAPMASKWRDEMALP